MSSVRPIDHILSVVNVARGPDHRGKYVAFCIAHDDRNTPNLHVEEDEHQNVLLWCSAGCSQEQVLAALEERGVSRPDLFADRNEAGGGGIDLPPKSAATVQPCTLEVYSEKKKLPIEWLREQGLSDVHYLGVPAVRIPTSKKTAPRERCASGSLWRRPRMDRTTASGGARALSPCSTGFGGWDKPGKPDMWCYARAKATP